uniref:FHA domain-containing protein n=1 Tax=Panagrolaimus superbus TaxID=310955 RepID=A0A914Y8N6_9BILA
MPSDFLNDHSNFNLSGTIQELEGSADLFEVEIRFYKLNQHVEIINSEDTDVFIEIAFYGKNQFHSVVTLSEKFLSQKEDEIVDTIDVIEDMEANEDFDKEMIIENETKTRDNDAEAHEDSDEKITIENGTKARDNDSEDSEDSGEEMTFENGTNDQLLDFKLVSTDGTVFNLSVAHSNIVGRGGDIDVDLICSRRSVAINLTENGWEAGKIGICRARINQIPLAHGQRHLLKIGDTLVLSKF